MAVMQASRSTPAAALRAAVLQAAAADGGWAYYPGDRSRIEPTCWALMALMPRTVAAGEAALSKGVAFLESLQDSNGWLIDPGTVEPNFGWNALAIIALRGADASGTARRGPTELGSGTARRIVTALRDAKGIQSEGDSTAVRLNGKLQAWSWTPGTFSWVEPSAYALVALKQRRAAGDAGLDDRIREAEAMLIDRACAGGGWNYGNPQVLAQDLRPYVPTTAVALLALHDRAGERVVMESVDWLAAHALSERSALALSWSAVCLHVFARPTAEVIDALRRQLATTDRLGNLHARAMALHALTLDIHGGAAWRV